MTSAIDRIAPTRRPRAPVRGYQRWRSLLFMHWAVDAHALREVVPGSLELDLHEGVAYVGLVPFEMRGVRPRWLPEALSFDFLESNLRTYVHVNGRDPGVYFFSLDASSWLAVKAARIGWGLPYFHAAMKLSRDGDRRRYEVERTASTRLLVDYEPGAALGASRPGSLEHFLVERYLLHVERRGKLWTGQVHHPPYPLQRADVLDLSDTTIGSAGLPQPAGPPLLAHYASGVDVEIFGLTRRRDGDGLR